MSSNVKPGTLAFLVSLVGRTEQSRHTVHNGNEAGLRPYSNREPLSRASRHPIIITHFHLLVVSGIVCVCV
jgi:hypothetical protein